MIKVALDRRDSDREWGVVRQVDHARLAFDLAERSVLLDDLLPTVTSEVLCAIDHHDDGWQERDLELEIDKPRARPRTFDEMTGEEATEIWARSIHRARGFGLLSAWTVAGHFSYLAGLKQDSDVSLRWAAKMDVERADWLETWCGDHQDAAASSTALACLKLFDSLSLYVIGAGSEGQRRLTLPDGRSVIITRGTGGVYSADPWFFERDSFSLHVAGVRVLGTDIVDTWHPTIRMQRFQAA